MIKITRHNEKLAITGLISERGCGEAEAELKQYDLTEVKFQRTKYKWNDTR